MNTNVTVRALRVYFRMRFINIMRKYYARTNAQNSKTLDSHFH